MQSGMSLLGQKILSQSRNLIYSIFNGVSKSLTYGKVVRSSFFLLFLASSALCLRAPQCQSGLIAILSLIAFITFDVVSSFRRPAYKDFSIEFEALRKKNEELEEQFKGIKSDLSIAKISTAFQARR